MDILDQMIRSGMRRAVDQVEPAADLWARVERGLARPQPARRIASALAVLAAAAVALTVVLPGPRTLAGTALERVFRIAGVVYSVASGVPRVPPPAGGREIQAGVADQENVLIFTGEPGQFPAAARQAIQDMKPAFRIPGWLPPGMAVRVYIHGAGGRKPAAASGQQAVDMVLSDDAGNAIFISQLAPAPVELGILTGRDDHTAGEVDLGAVRALEVRNGRTVSYHFTAGGVLIKVSGPLEQAGVVRQVAESLAP